MTTKIIFNTDKKLKDAVMKKSKASGMTLSSFLNLAMHGYMRDQFQVGIIDKEIAIGREDVKKGQTENQDDVFRDLGIE